MALLSADGRPASPDLATSILKRLSHRGDRDARLEFIDEIALGHASYPTTPEAEREVLPGTGPSGRFWLTWDGRLDNRDELFEALGIPRRDGTALTDADLVIRAFETWDIKCLDRFVGDWAIIVWDRIDHRLIAAKDPLGWRQLYYAATNGALLLASEPQAMFGQGVPREANWEYLRRALGDALQEPGSTCWEGVLEVVGGQALVVQRGDSRIITFWSEPRRVDHGLRRPDEFVEAFEALFADATKARLRSNRPMASLVSGGLDSSYVTAVAAKYADIAAYTLYVPGSQFLDERPYARMVADRHHVSLTEVDTTDCWYLSQKWLPPTTFDQPFVPGAGPSLMAVTSRAQADGVGVILGGEGGDEWLDGTPWDGSSDVPAMSALMAGRLPTAMRILRASAPTRPILLEAAAMVGRSTVPVLLRERIRPRRQWQFPTYLDPSPEWIPAHSITSMPGWHRSSLKHQAMFRLYRHVADPEIAWRDRALFLGKQLELRSPLNDLRLVEFLFSIPAWAKRADGFPRDILRSGLRNERLPEIAARLDKGFYEEQLRTGLQDRERERFTRAIDALRVVPGIDFPRLVRDVEQWIERPHRWSRSIYRLGTAGMWIDQLNDGSKSALVAPSTESSGWKEVRCNAKAILGAEA